MSSPKLHLIRPSQAVKIYTEPRLSSHATCRQKRSVLPYSIPECHSSAPATKLGYASPGDVGKVCHCCTLEPGKVQWRWDRSRWWEPHPRRCRKVPEHCVACYDPNDISNSRRDCCRGLHETPWLWISNIYGTKSGSLQVVGVDLYLSWKSQSLISSPTGHAREESASDIQIYYKLRYQ